MQLSEDTYSADFCRYEPDGVLMTTAVVLLTEEVLFDTFFIWCLSVFFVFFCFSLVALHVALHVSLRFTAPLTSDLFTSTQSSLRQDKKFTLAQLLLHLDLIEQNKIIGSREETQI